jgi:hypothetical protein
VTNLDFEYSYEVGQLYDRVYAIGVRASPNLNAVEEFAAMLYWVRQDGTVVEVARIDDIEHPNDDQSGPHIHRWYRETATHEREYGIPVQNWHEADEYLADNFPEFARRYETNHGRDIVAYQDS